MKSHTLVTLRQLHGLVLLLFLPALLLAQNSDLGEIDFPTSGPAPAQNYFIKGVLLLHSFEYEDAADEFRQAQKIDPDFAMAYWGEAMTHNHPLWMQVNVEEGKAILNRLAPTPEARLAKAPTPREKGYLQAIEILYGASDKKVRDLAYADAMRRFSEQFSEDLEAASFYALALLGTCHDGRDFATYMKAAAIAERVFQKNPRHPGAVHYLIHSYDDPIHAPLGLSKAQVYAKIAPAAAHALHMPSHIFFALGMWDEAAASNEESWSASLARQQRRNLPLAERGYHSLLWREYAYLQQGRFREAKAMLDLMAADAQKSDARRLRFHLAAMRAAYVIDTQSWNSEAARLPTNTSGFEKDLIAGDLFVTGMIAVKTGDLAKAEKILGEIEAVHPAIAIKPTLAGGSDALQCHAAPNEAAGYSLHLQAVEVMAAQLQALILLHKEKSTDAIKLLQQAAAAEDRMTFEFGPPVIVKPAHELLGEILLEQNRPQEARDEFVASLRRTPNRLLSLVGLKRAALQAGDQAKAQEAQATLRKILHRADPELAGLAQLN